MSKINLIENHRKFCDFFFIFEKKVKMSTLTENKTVLAHQDFFEILRNVEYKRLDNNKQVYLDYTGGNLYAKSQIMEHQDLLINNIL